MTEARRGRPSENLKGFTRHVSPLEFAGIRRPLESTVEFVLKVSLRSEEGGGRGGRKGESFTSESLNRKHNQISLRAAAVQSY